MDTSAHGKRRMPFEQLKNTKQRAAILALLDTSREPVSAEDLYEKMKDDFPSLAISTVYRNLERFTALGIVEKEALPDGVLRFSPRQSGMDTISSVPAAIKKSSSRNARLPA